MNFVKFSDLLPTCEPFIVALVLILAVVNSVCSMFLEHVYALEPIRDMASTVFEGLDI